MRASRALVVFTAFSLIIVLLATTKNRKVPAAPLRPANVLLISNTPATRPTTAPTAAPIVAIAPTTQPSTRPIVIELPPPAPILTPLMEARGKLISDPLSTRRILSDELQVGHFNPAEQDEARELLAKANEQLVFSRRVFRDDPLVTTHTIQPGDRLLKIALGFNITPELLMHINPIKDPKLIRPGQQIKVIRGPFHAVVNKGRFAMDIYLGAPGGPGSTFVTSYRVGLGKDDSTPVGIWKAERKLKNPVYYSPRGEGIIAADDPKNPLGEYRIGLAGVDGSALGKSSYGIHGTIDPSSIGREESMGCIRMRNEDVAVVYELLVEGKSLIVVRD